MRQWVAVASIVQHREKKGSQGLVNHVEAKAVTEMPEDLKMTWKWHSTPSENIRSEKKTTYVDKDKEQNKGKKQVNTDGTFQVLE